MTTNFILALDPGLTSGIAFVDALEHKVIESHELPWFATAEVCNRLMNVGGPAQTALVCESFVITTATAKNSQAPFSLELIGIYKYLARVNGYGDADVAFQKPSDAKNFVPDARLRALDLWHRGGAGHANDALRHAALFLVRSGWAPKELLN